jgi:predicted helicase
LHDPIYREKYKEFLKIDFPRVPFPESKEEFWRYVNFGSRLRRLHLMERVQPEAGLADFPVAGTNEVAKPSFVGADLRVCPNDHANQNEGRHTGQPLQSCGRVYINDTQYFYNIPEEVWNFYIGGYQPAQKWLKDRKGFVLSYEDILHYQKIIKVLKETNEIMREINESK